MPETPKLVCPYTGRCMEMKFYARPGHDSGHYLIGGYDPAAPALDRETLAAALRMRDGKSNASRALKCPYTGAKITIEEGEKGLWWAKGNYFSPMTFQKDPQTLIYLASCRDGKPLAGVAKESPKVKAELREEPPSDPRENLFGRKNELVDAAVEHIVGGLDK